MAPRLPLPWACLRQVPASLTPRRLLLPRTTRRGVKYGWSNSPAPSAAIRHSQTEAGIPPLTTGPEAALKRKEATTPVRTGLLAFKQGMTAVFKGKRRIPCTVLRVEHSQVVATKNVPKHGYWAVQVGVGSRKADNVPVLQLGEYEAKGIPPKEHLAEFKVRNETGLLPVGLQLQPDWFNIGQYVDVRSKSKGKGFAGGMKRWGFAGQPASHGNSKTHRAIGTVGPSQGGGSRVHPGKKMPGRMGGQRVTVQNLKVLRVDNELGIVVVHGAVGGPKGGVVMIQDAIKKKQLSEFKTERAMKVTMERNEGVEEHLRAARARHVDLKKKRLAQKVRRANRESVREAAYA